MAIREFTTQELESEEWRPVDGFDGIYSVSNLGRVKREVTIRNHRAGTIKQPTENHKGYLRVMLSDKGRKKVFRVHRLVASAFIGRCPDGWQVNHKDPATGKTDNRASNLEYVTPIENMRHARLNGLVAKGDKSGSRLHPERRARGENHGRAKLKDSDVALIFKFRGEGLLHREIAEALGVSPSCIGYILRGKIRKAGLY